MQFSIVIAAHCIVEKGRDAFLVGDFCRRGGSRANAEADWSCRRVVRHASAPTRPRDMCVTERISTAL